MYTDLVNFVVNSYHLGSFQAKANTEPWIASANQC